MPPPLPELPGVQHRFETVRGVRLHYAETGAGDPLLLVHGWPQHWWMWRHHIAPLAERFRVIAPDLRGHGWSDKPRSSYRKTELRDDVLALLDALGIERARWVGHDWGAFAGLLAALDRPERIERLVAMSFPHPWRRRPDPRSALALLYQPIVGGPAGALAMRRGFARVLLRAGRSIGAYGREELDAYDAIQREPDAAAASVRMYRTFMLHELVPFALGRLRRARLTVPTLWLVGEHDVLARSDDGYLSHADDMTLEVVEDANHFMPEELPDATVRRILAFL